MSKTNCKDHWDLMDPKNFAKAGNQWHQKKDEEIWKNAIKNLNLDNPSNNQKEHLDLCCGDGRIITQVILHLDNKFKLHTGVDISSSFI